MFVCRPRLYTRGTPEYKATFEGNRPLHGCSHFQDTVFPETPASQPLTRPGGRIRTGLDCPPPVWSSLSGRGWGIPPLVTATYVSSLFMNAPATWNLSEWYATPLWISTAVTVAIALYGLRHSLAGRRLLGALDS